MRQSAAGRRPSRVVSPGTAQWSALMAGFDRLPVLTPYLGGWCGNESAPQRLGNDLRGRVTKPRLPSRPAAWASRLPRVLRPGLARPGHRRPLPGRAETPHHRATSRPARRSDAENRTAFITCWSGPRSITGWTCASSTTAGPPRHPRATGGSSSSSTRPRPPRSRPPPCRAASGDLRRTARSPAGLPRVSPCRRRGRNGAAIPSHRRCRGGGGVRGMSPWPAAHPRPTADRRRAADASGGVGRGFRRQFAGPVSAELVGAR